MGVRFPSASSSTLLTGTLVTSALTAILNSPGIILPLDGAQVIIIAIAAVTVVGASTTILNSSIFRGANGSGIQLTGPGNMNVTAGGQASVVAFAIDTPGASGPVVYSMTLQQTSATGNGTVFAGTILAFCL